MVENDEDLWCAFIEIDHFKRINDTYGYLAGNAMIKKVADTLRFAVDQFLGGDTVAFHAHGDEFYLVGQQIRDRESIQRCLEVVRENIVATTVKMDGFEKPMTATVTIGWIMKSSLLSEEVSRHRLRTSVEDAVAYGKRQGRNRTLMYGTAMKEGKFFSERGNCNACEAAFTMDVEKSKLGSEPVLWCPNCGAKQARPERQAGATAEAEV